MKSSVAIHTQNFSSFTRYISHNITHIFFRDCNFYFIYWFKKTRFRFHKTFPETLRACNFKWHLIWIYIVESTIKQCNFNINYFIAWDHSFFHSLYNSLFNSRNKSSRHNTSNNSINKLESFTTRHRLHFKMYMTVLSSATGLFLMLILCVFSSSFNSFPIRNPWFFQININTVTFF